MKITSILLGLLAFLMTALPFIRTNAWWIRVLDFPRLQIAVFCLLTLFLLFKFLNYRKLSNQVLIALVAGAFIYQLTLIIPYTPLYPVEVPFNSDVRKDDHFTILHSNVKMTNRQAKELLALVEKYQPDILSVNEPDEWWAQQLQPLDKSYPYRMKKPLSNTYGMMLFSKLPLRSKEINFLVKEDVPSFFAEVVLPSGKMFNLHCLHPEPPRPGSSTYERDTELLIVGRQLRKSGEPALVVGDLNDVAWSRTSKKFKQYGNVVDPRRGRGLFSTFNANWPLLRYPLDHFFFTRDFVLNDLQKLSDIGSDHFPMYISLSLREQVGEE